MTGVNPNPVTGNDNSLAEGAPATHIGPETGDTARATMGEGSSAGTHGSTPSPAEGSGIGNTTRPPERLDEEGRSFQGQAGQAGQGGESADTASEAVRRVADGDTRPGKDHHDKDHHDKA